MTQDASEFGMHPGNFSSIPGLSSYENSTMCTFGNYCPPASDAETACPIGFKMDIDKQGHNEYNCRACDEGEVCDTEVFTGTPGTCEAGYFCPEAAESSTRIPCPSGSYSDSTGLGYKDECTNCTAGQFCPGGQSSNNENCPAGFYCPERTYFKNETVCPMSYYSLGSTQAKDASECLPCPEGSYCGAGNGTATVCPAQSYCPALSHNKTNCEPGKQVSGTGSSTPSDCDSCDLGYICPGGTEPIECPKGFYMDDFGGQFECKPTTLGYFTSSTGQQSEQVCSAGSFSQPGAIACHDCAPGYYCSGDGQSRICSEGKYCPMGSPNEQDCPSGAYCNRTMVGQTLHCPPGSYCPDGGDPQPTPAKYYNV